MPYQEECAVAEAVTVILIQHGSAVTASALASLSSHHESNRCFRFQFSQMNRYCHVKSWETLKAS